MNLFNNSSETGFFGGNPMFVYDYYSFEIIEVNEAAVKLYGFTPGDFREKRFIDLGERVDPSQLKGLNSEKYNPTAIWEHQTKKGNRIYVQLTSHLINYKGKPAQFTIAHHIDELVRNEKDFGKLPRIESVRAHIPMGMIEWDRSFNVRDWSDKAGEIFGWEFEEVRGMNLFEIGLLPVENREMIEKQLEDFITGEKNYFSTESENITKQGRHIYCNWHNAAIYDQDQNLVSIYSLVEDITDKRVAQKQLIESENRFRILSEASLVGIYMIQGDKFKYVNPRFCSMTGYSSGELVDKKEPFHLVHPDDTWILKQLKQKWEKDAVNSFDKNLKAITKEGRIIHVRAYGSRGVLNGKPAVIGVVTDQTKQVEMYRNYKESLESYKDLFNSISDAIYILDRDNRFIEVNHGAVKMYGYEKDEFIGNTPELLAAPGKVDMQLTQTYMEKTFAGEVQQFEWWGKKKNGEIFLKEVQLNPGTYFGEPVVIAIARDISERYEQEQEIKHNEELFRQLFQNAPIGIALLDEHKEVILVNKGFEQIFGFDTNEVRDVSLDKVIVPEEKRNEASSLSGSTQTFEVNTYRRRKDGKLVDVIIYGVPVTVEGKIIGIYGIYVDITDRKIAEQKIRESLKEKEVLLAEIHHRVKNNLAVITGLLELQAQGTDDASAKQVLRDSQLRINSMALIHEKLYQSENFSKIQFGNYISELTDVITRSYVTNEKPVEFNIQSDPAELTITQAIPCGLLLNEVVTNAMKHAFEGRDKGEIEIKMKKEGEKIRLTISDDGVGLPDNFEELEKKSLGMTLIHTLTSQLNGELEIQSNGGTAYELVFPVDEVKHKFQA